MAKKDYRIWNIVDAVLPWTIVIPFYIFTFGNRFFNGIYTSTFDEIKQAVIKDLKSGVIRELFLRVWLRENTVNRVIFNNNNFKMWSLDLFQRVARNHKVQQQLDLLVSKTINLKEISERVNRGFSKQKPKLSQKFWNTIDSYPELRKEIFYSILMNKVIEKFYINKELGKFDFLTFLNTLNN